MCRGACRSCRVTDNMSWLRIAMIRSSVFDPEKSSPILVLHLHFFSLLSASKRLRLTQVISL
ncbi:Protein of unknown function [Pyronema omphalodes CBS 100304]|uniref:Uncharacterized protein n=1 Tax=Pyronema omphalodes (strain CBS 100304) TaxID=1076935 RepID=U4LSL5_PYROM|nr:Protein of unknown function [Pyronema omphalodes CBS 100304]